MKLLSIVLLFIVAPSLTFAQTKSNKTSREQRRKDEIEQLLRRMTDEWTQVDVTHDKSVLERFMADDFVSTSRSGPGAESAGVIRRLEGRGGDERG